MRLLCSFAFRAPPNSLITSHQCNGISRKVLLDIVLRSRRGLAKERVVSRGWVKRLRADTVLSQRGLCRITRLEIVGRALYTVWAALCHVSVDHGGFQVAMTEQLLDGSYVCAGFQEVGGE
jgi:hypothetical protein